MADYSFDVNQAGTLGINSTLAGLDNINVDSTVHVPEPVTSDATLHVPEPVVSDATVRVPDVVRSDSTFHSPEPIAVSSAIDVQPLAVDTCTRVVLGPLPPTRVRSPWKQRIGLSVFGVELFAWTVSGEFRTYVDGRVDGRDDGCGDGCAGGEQHRSHADGGGIEIRLGDERR
jgi:hypothetical protein